jgi:hypothetical protein
MTGGGRERGCDVKKAARPACGAVSVAHPVGISGRGQGALVCAKSAAHSLPATQTHPRSAAHTPNGTARRAAISGAYRKRYLSPCGDQRHIPPTAPPAEWRSAAHTPNGTSPRAAIRRGYPKRYRPPSDDQRRIPPTVHLPERRSAAHTPNGTSSAPQPQARQRVMSTAPERSHLISSPQVRHTHPHMTRHVLAGMDRRCAQARQAPKRPPQPKERTQ